MSAHNCVCLIVRNSLISHRLTSRWSEMKWELHLSQIGWASQLANTLREEIYEMKILRFSDMQWSFQSLHINSKNLPHLLVLLSECLQENHQKCLANKRTKHIHAYTKIECNYATKRSLLFHCNETKNPLKWHENDGHFLLISLILYYFSSNAEWLNLEEYCYNEIKSHSVDEHIKYENDQQLYTVDFREMKNLSRQASLWIRLSTIECTHECLHFVHFILLCWSIVVNICVVNDKIACR